MMAIEQLNTAPLSQRLTGYTSCQKWVKAIIDVADRQENLSPDIKIRFALYQITGQSQNYVLDPEKAIRVAVPAVEKDLGIDLNNPKSFRTIRNTIFDNIDEYEEFQKELLEVNDTSGNSH